jgi:hypothetical protein
VLLASALKLLNASNTLLVIVLVAVAIIGPLLWASVYRRARAGDPSLPRISRLLADAATGRTWRRPQARQKPPETIHAPDATDPNEPTGLEQTGVER